MQATGFMECTFCIIDGSLMQFAVLVLFCQSTSQMCLQSMNEVHLGKKSLVQYSQTGVSDSMIEFKSLLPININWKLNFPSGMIKRILVTFTFLLQFLLPSINKKKQLSTFGLVYPLNWHFEDYNLRILSNDWPARLDN